MIKHFLHIIFTISCFVVFSQTDRLNFTDSLGRRQGHWIYFGKDRPDSGVPLEGKIEEGNYVNDRKTGYWIKYHPDGKTVRLVGEYEQNRPKGNFVIYNSKGCKIKEGYFVRNSNYDSLVEFHDNEIKKYEAWFNEFGKEHGTVNYYHENGKLEFTVNVVNGVPSDTAYRYYNNGDLKEQVIFDSIGQIMNTIQFEQTHPTDATFSTNDALTAPDLSKIPGKYPTNELPEGFHKIYNDDGDLWLEGKFEKGKLINGKEYIYDDNGILLKVRVYKSGSFHSE